MTGYTRKGWLNRTLRVLALTQLSCPANAQSCSHALVLALDVSGSVNAVEYAQQINGLASALNDPDVRDLILSGAGAPVSLAVFEWSSRNHQFVIQPWVSLDSAAALDRAILRVRSHRKVRAGLKTAMGTALSFAAVMLEQKPQCWKRTIDVSADGKNNIGITPQQAYLLPDFQNITVNALVVGDPSGDSKDDASLTPEALQSYFDTNVIQGPNAFSMIAEGYADYTQAMRRKLVKELELPTFGAADHRFAD